MYWQFLFVHCSSSHISHWNNRHCCVFCNNNKRKLWQVYNFPAYYTVYKKACCKALTDGISFHFHFWDINDKKIVFDIDMIFYDSFIPFLIKNRLNNLPFKSFRIYTCSWWRHTLYMIICLFLGIYNSYFTQSMSLHNYFYYITELHGCLLYYLLLF